MSALPTQYSWLSQEPGPKMLVEALKLYAVSETPGPKNNPVLMAWADLLGLGGVYRDDTATPWCGLFVAYVALKAGKPVVKDPLWARNWIKWGEPTAPELGCVLVFSRGTTSGHVGIYVGEDDKCFHVLGGNQGDKVCIVRIPRERLLAARALYNTKPANVRPVHLVSTGSISSNEA